VGDIPTPTDFYWAAADSEGQTQFQRFGPACKEEAPCWGHGAFIQIDQREAVVTAEVAVVGAHHRNCVLLLALFAFRN
jgi:hypothetical protein